MKDEIKHRAQNAIPTVGNIPMFRPSRIIMEVDASQVLSCAKYVHQLQILAKELLPGSRKRAIFMDEVSRVSSFIRKQSIINLYRLK